MPPPLTEQQSSDIASPFWRVPTLLLCVASNWTPGEDYPNNPGPEWLCGTDWHNEKRKAS